MSRQEIIKKEKDHSIRMTALKEQNWEIYIKYLDAIKDERLLKILEQTD